MLHPVPSGPSYDGLLGAFANASQARQSESVQGSLAALLNHRAGESYSATGKPANFPCAAPNHMDSKTLLEAFYECYPDDFHRLLGHGITSVADARQSVNSKPNPQQDQDKMNALACVNLLMQQLNHGPNRFSAQDPVQTQDPSPTHLGQSMASSMTVTAETDVVKAAAVVHQYMSQPGSPCFTLYPRPDAINSAFQIVLVSRRLMQSSQSQYDTGFVPVVPSENLDMMSLFVIRIPAQHHNKDDNHTIRIESLQSPVLNAMAITGVLNSTAATPQIIFSQDAALTAWQSLSMARLNVLGSGQDTVVLPDVIHFNDHVSDSEVFYHFRVVLSPCQSLDMRGGHDAITFLHLPHGKSAVKRTSASSVLLPCSTPDSLSTASPNRTTPSTPTTPMTPLTPGHKTRARKADYVIVTEDTSIKNAAGAVAKVLGRVSAMGLCCPVYTEKKTETFTAVISVAVKAIAVARGYVCNEGTGHEVGFQPYYHSLERDAGSQDLQLYLLEKKLLQSLSKHGATAVIKSINNMDSPEEELNLSDDSEMAFDVFKIPAVAEPGEASNIPVKVTAHSRHSVVSNIIIKLVTERDSAVLITAGGKAMHVAMTAVVSARARLRARGIDVLLLPKFVTVDTTSTLGWESVFLRFNIVRWGPALISGEMLGGPMGDVMSSRFILTPTLS